MAPFFAQKFESYKKNNSILAALFLWADISGFLVMLQRLQCEGE